MRRDGRPLFSTALLGALLATAGASALPAAEITGRAVDEDDAPLAGAVVTLHPVVSGAERGALWLAGRAHPEPVARARTGDDGVFRLDAPDADPPFWTVVVRAEGRVPMEKEVGPLFDFLDLPPVTLPESEPAVVRVVGPDGAPLAGVPVLFSAGSSSFRFRYRLGPWTPGGFRVGRTGPDGRASLHRAAVETGEVVVPAPGRFARAELSGPRVRLELPAEGEPGDFVVRVLAPDGSPAPGAVIRSPGRDRFPVAVTGEDGEAVLPAGALAGGVPAEGGEEAPTVRVETRHGWWAEVAAGSFDRDPEDAAEEPWIVRLATPPGVRGTVREPQGEPVAGAVVWVEGDSAGAVRSGEAGAFALDLRAGGRALLRAAGPGHRQPAYGQVEGGEPASGVELFLSPTALWTGRVEDTGGRGLESASVEASMKLSTFSMHSSCRMLSARARTGRDGRFRLVGISPDCDYRVTAELDGYAPVSVEVPRPAEGSAPEPLLLVLSTGHRLTGRVTDDTGAPVPGARVVFEPDQGRDGSMASSLPEAVTGPEGLFSLDHLPPTPGDLHVEAPGFALLERPGIQVPVAAPDTPEATDLGDLALEPEVSLVVRVEDDSGEAVAGAWVQVRAPSLPLSSRELRRRRAGQAPPEPLTDESGTFRVGGFRAGDRTTVRVGSEGHAPEAFLGVRVPEDSPLRVVLRPGAVISGRVVDETGRPVPEAGVSAGEAGHEMFPAGRWTSAEADEEGRFELRDLPPGSLTLSGSHEEKGSSASVLVEVEAGEHRRDVELVLREEARPKLLVRVVAPDGSIPPRASVSFGGANWGSTCLGPRDGLYTCGARNSDGPGTYEVTAQVPGVGAGKIEVELGETDRTVDLHLEPEQEISGRVVTADGEPAPGLRVLLPPVDPGGGMMLRETTAADGSFAFRGVLEGPYHLMVDRDVREVSPPPSYLYPEEIELPPGGSVTGLLVTLDTVTVVRGEILGASPEAGGVSISGRPNLEEGWKAPARGSFLDGGRYRIHLTPGTWRIVASERGGGRSAEEEIVIAPGETERILDLDLSPGLDLVGVVRVGGEPESGLEVWAVESPHVRAVTDLRGRFELHGLEPGRQRVVVADRYSRRLALREVVPEEEGELVVDIRVGRVRGTVVSSVGAEPLADATVRLVPAPASAADPATGTRIPPEPVRTGSTTVDGRFVIDRVPAGTYTLTIEKAGHQQFTTELHVTGGEIELAPVTLEPAPP